MLGLTRADIGIALDRTDIAIDAADCTEKSRLVISGSSELTHFEKYP